MGRRSSNALKLEWIIFLALHRVWLHSSKGHSEGRRRRRGDRIEIVYLLCSTFSCILELTFPLLFLFLGWHWERDKLITTLNYYRLQRERESDSFGWQRPELAFGKDREAFAEITSNKLVFGTFVNCCCYCCTRSHAIFWYPGESFSGISRGKICFCLLVIMSSCNEWNELLNSELSSK